jgi:excisionase family DNA binding protein
MRIADYPKTLPYKEQYTAGELAILLSVSRRTATRLIDNGLIPGFTAPGTRERRVLFSTIKAYVVARPQYAHVLAKIQPRV